MADFGAVVLLALLHFVVAQFPHSSFILKAKSICNYTDHSAAVVINSDVVLNPMALCRGKSMHFDKLSSSEYILEVFYDSSYLTKECTFKTAGTIYTVELLIAWGQKGGLMITSEESYTITCTIDLRTQKESSMKDIGESLIAPKEMQGHTGKLSGNDVLVTIHNILHQEIKDKTIPRGKLVHIMATAKLLPDFIFGIQASSCSVVGKTSSYAVIRGGCGDGLVFARNAGFITKGLRTYSPQFNWFGLKFQERIKFVCNFTLCDTYCNGNSCVHARKKRSSTFLPILHGESPVFAAAPPIGHKPEFERILVLDPSEDLSEVNQHEESLEGEIQYMWISLSVTAIMVTVSAVLSIFLFLRRKADSSPPLKIHFPDIKM